MSDQRSSNGRTSTSAAELRRLYALGCGGEDDITDEELVALAQGELDERVREKLLDRLLESPDAVARYQLLLAIRAGAPKAGASGRRPRYWAMAASIVVAVIASILLIPQPIDEVRVRGTSAEVAPTGMILLARPPVELRWATDGRTGRRQVTLFSEDAMPLWSVEIIAEGQYRLSDAERASIAAGGVFFWTVADTGGEEQGPYWFVVEPGAE